MSNHPHANTIELVGRLGQPPELKRTEDGTPYVRLSVATSERFVGQGGKVRDKTEWHNAVAWGPEAEQISGQFKKGDSIALSGTLRINSYEREGVKNRVTEINIDEAKLNVDKTPSKSETRLVGVVREEPKFRDFEDGKRLTTLNVATTTMVAGKTGLREREDWHSVAAWGKTAEAAREIKTGDTIAIDGTLRHRTLPGEDGGRERRLSAIECGKFQVLERAKQLSKTVAPQIRSPGKGQGKGIDRGM
jgi:single-strand DNA-binding protein